MSGLTVAFMVGAAAGFAAVVWYRAMRREVRYGTGAKVRRNIARATELGVPRAAQKEFCRGMRDAERTMAERGYCEARRDAGVMQRQPRTGAYDRGFLQWLDDFAAGMPTAPGRCTGVAKWEGCRLCRWSRGPRRVNRGVPILMAAAADEIDALRKQTGWQPMETAPKDGTPILARCDHAADEDYGDRLSVYASHAEGTRHVPDGLHVVVWGGAYEEAGDEYGYGSYTMPDWWFRAGSDFEEVANPVAWMPIPGATEKEG